MNIFTFTYVFTVEEAEILAKTGADIINSHLRTTKGGEVRATTKYTLQDASTLSQDIFNVARSVNKDIILFAHGGPIETPKDVRHVLQHTDVQGFIGGSAAERMPIEEAILAATQAFKIGLE